LVIIFLVVFIDLLGFGIVLPLLPRYGQHFQAQGWELGLLMASFSAMQFWFAPVWGRLSDRYGRRPILLVGLLGSTLAYGTFGLITQLGNRGPILGLSPFYWLVISRIAAGIAGATIPTAQAYIADTTTQAGRGKGMALIGMAFGAGFTFGPLLGSLFATGSEGEHLPPSPAPGYLAAVLSGLAFIAALGMLPETRREANGAGRHRELFSVTTLVAALRRPYVGWVLAAIFLTTFAFAQFESTLSLLTKGLRVSDRGNFYLFAYIGFILVLAQGFLVRRFLGKLGEYRMSLIGITLMTLGMALLARGTMPGTTLDYLAYVLPVVVVGFAGINPSLQGLLSLHAGDDEQGGVLGIGQSMSSLARILGPLVGLTLQDVGPGWPYWFATALMAGCILFIGVGLAGAQPRRPTVTDAADPDAGH
jgi:MFS family permease